MTQTTITSWMRPGIIFKLWQVKIYACGLTFQQGPELLKPCPFPPISSSLTWWFTSSQLFFIQLILSPPSPFWTPSGSDPSRLPIPPARMGNSLSTSNIDIFLFVLQLINQEKLSRLEDIPRDILFFPLTTTLLGKWPQSRSEPITDSQVCR